MNRLILPVALLAVCLTGCREGDRFEALLTGEKTPDQIAAEAPPAPVVGFVPAPLVIAPELVEPESAPEPEVVAALEPEPVIVPPTPEPEVTLVPAEPDICTPIFRILSCSDEGEFIWL